MKSVSTELEALLDDWDEGSRRSCALLASELVAQVVGRAPTSQNGPVGLTVRLSQDAVRLEASGTVAPSIGATANDAVPADPLADWGWFILNRLSDRWGMGGGARREIWAEIR